MNKNVLIVYTECPQNHYALVKGQVSRTHAKKCVVVKSLVERSEAFVARSATGLCVNIQSNIIIVLYNCISSDTCYISDP